MLNIDKCFVELLRVNWGRIKPLKSLNIIAFSVISTLLMKIIFFLMSLIMSSYVDS